MKTTTDFRGPGLRKAPPSTIEIRCRCDGSMGTIPGNARPVPGPTGRSTAHTLTCETCGASRTVHTEPEG